MYPADNNLFSTLQNKYNGELASVYALLPLEEQQKLQNKVHELITNYFNEFELSFNYINELSNLNTHYQILKKDCESLLPAFEIDQIDQKEDLSLQEESDYTPRLTQINHDLGTVYTALSKNGREDFTNLVANTIKTIVENSYREMDLNNRNINEYTSLSNKFKILFEIFKSSTGTPPLNPNLVTFDSMRLKQEIEKDDERKTTDQLVQEFILLHAQFVHSHEQDLRRMFNR